MKPRTKIRVPRRGMGYREDNTNFETTWSLLASSLREIHTKNASNLSFEELYRTTYQLMLTGRGITLHDKVCELEREWLRNDVLPKIAAFVTPSLLIGEETVATDQVNETRDAGERFLAKLRELWEDHQLCMGMVTDVLMYMDRVMANEHRLPSIYTTAMSLYRDYILRANVGPESHSTVYSVFESTVLFIIRLEREGSMVDRSLVRHCMYMLEGLYEADKEDENGKLYFSTFEPAFLNESRRFYEAEGQHLLTTADAATFCRRVSTRISEEEDRCRFALVPASEVKIQEVLNEFLIQRNIDDVIAMEDSGVKYMLDNDRLDDLSNVYSLVSRIDPKKTALSKAVQARIVELGEKLNLAAKEFVQTQAPNQNKNQDAKAGSKDKTSDEKSPANVQTAAAIKWIDDVLQLKGKFDRVWEQAFEKDQTLQTALTSSFGDFINVNSRSAEYLSLFFDENLKKGVKGKTEEQLDSLLETGITLLRYIRDKDHFETYYKKHLSRRLLLKRSDMESERQIISKMKMEVGNTFTQRLEAMFKDMGISAGLTKDYSDHMAGMGDPEQKRVELEMNVLTSTMWPMEIMSSARDGTSATQCAYPREIEKLKQSFENFYLSKHNGRKLSWQPGMGTAEIRATFPRPNGKVERHELNVSTYAMVVLSLFNDVPQGESLSFNEIQARTNIPENDLVRNLQSLAVAPKTRVLRKEPMSKNVKPSDLFFFNDEFHSKYTRLKIGVVSSGASKVETKDERTETEKKMTEERGAMIEAAVVRTMKQRKKLPHSQLLTEVISQLASRFTPDVNLVKRRIESLIDREYLERLPDVEPPSYGYVA